VNVPLEEHFPRFTLEDSEHVCLIATSVAAGHGEEINLLPDQRQSWFLSFARSLNGDVEEAVNAIFSMLQRVLMAQRKHDFATINSNRPSAPLPALARSPWQRRQDLGAPHLRQSGSVAAGFCSKLERSYPQADSHHLYWRSRRLCCHRNHYRGAGADDCHSWRILVFQRPFTFLTGRISFGGLASGAEAAGAAGAAAAGAAAGVAAGVSEDGAGVAGCWAAGVAGLSAEDGDDCD